MKGRVTAPLAHQVVDSALATVIAHVPCKTERQVSVNVSLAPMLQLELKEARVNYYIVPSSEQEIEVDPAEHLCRLTEGRGFSLIILVLPYHAFSSTASSAIPKANVLDRASHPTATAREPWRCHVYVRGNHPAAWHAPLHTDH